MYVWVIEMQTKRTKKWWPCAGAVLTLAEAKWECAEWRMSNPDDAFRIAKYVPIGE